MTTKTFMFFVFSVSYALGGFALMAKTAAGLPIDPGGLC
jgi:hypothetical protein